MANGTVPDPGWLLTWTNETGQIISTGKGDSVFVQEAGIYKLTVSEQYVTEPK